MLTVKVKPNAKQQRLIQQPDGTWVAQLKSPPVAGKANTELIALLAQAFDVPQSAVHIKTGGSGRIKRIAIAD